LNQSFSYKPLYYEFIQILPHSYYDTISLGTIHHYPKFSFTAII